MKSGIIITLYNKEKEIKKGVLEQFIAVCKNIHICLVNNGSTDGTLEAINSISEKFIDRLSVVSIRNKKEDESALKLGFRFLMNNASVSKVILSNKLNMNELQNISEISSTLNSN
jgi:dolichyl-phosphate beta-glucosyltransferase